MRSSLKILDTFLLEVVMGLGNGRLVMEKDRPPKDRFSCEVEEFGRDGLLPPTTLDIFDDVFEGRLANELESGMEGLLVIVSSFAGISRASTCLVFSDELFFR